MDKPDLRRLVKSLSGHGWEKWEKDLDEVTKQQRLGKEVGLGTLFNIGILSVFDVPDVIGFTSKLIYRACIDVVFPRRNIHLHTDDVQKPLQLFEIVLRHFDPDILCNRDSWNRDGLAEVIFQCELFAAFRDLIPRGHVWGKYANIKARGKGSI